MEGPDAGKELTAAGLERRFLPFLDPTVGDETEHALTREASFSCQPARDHHRGTLERAPEDRNRPAHELGGAVGRIVRQEEPQSRRERLDCEVGEPPGGSSRRPARQDAW